VLTGSIASEEALMTYRFNPRVSSILLHDARVLLQTEERLSFWALPGGRIEPGEMSDRALIREIKEEIGIDARIERLVWVIENLFAHGGTRFHEIALYYLVRANHLPGLAAPSEFRGREPRLIFRWFHVEELSQLDLPPALLRNRLQAIPCAVEHLQWVDEEM
jgi:ADP-ribose pyrophosphatase YjhB (NUDIX family)